MFSPSARIAALVLIFLLMAALFAPWVAPYGENEIVGEFWEPFSARSCFGGGRQAEVVGQIDR